MSQLPKNLDELIALLPTVARTRSLQADEIRWLLGRRRGECTWCGDPCGKGRHKWCSDQCVEEFKQRCQPGHYVELVIERDRGICQICGRDTLASEQEARAARIEESVSYRPGEDPAETKRRTQERLDLMASRFGYARGRFREVDHIVRVEHGGGLCRLDNLRTLCGVCHLRVTTEENANKSRIRSKR